MSNGLKHGIAQDLYKEGKAMALSNVPMLGCTAFKDIIAWRWYAMGYRSIRPLGVA